MNELTTIARPYAKASFEYACDTNALDEWSSVLTMLAEATKEQKVIDLLSSPKITAERKVSELIGLCGDTINDAMGRFLTVLAENKRLLLMPQINTLFEASKARKQKFTNVEVNAAFPLGKKITQQLVDKLGADLDSQVSITVNVNKTLIGGIVIHIGDTVIGNTIRS